MLKNNLSSQCKNCESAVTHDSRLVSNPIAIETSSSEFFNDRVDNDVFDPFNSSIDNLNHQSLNYEEMENNANLMRRISNASEKIQETIQNDAEQLNNNIQNNLSKTDPPSSNEKKQVANSGNRTNNACIIERLGHLCLSETLSDVYFMVGSTTNNGQRERIPGHKLILSIGSQVFMAMFYGTGFQLKPNETDIELPDIEPESFKKMLKYLYTDELNVEPDSVMSTLYISKKYAITALERECVDFLKANLKADNAFMLLQQSRLFDEFQLSELCLELIDKYSNEAFSAECFLEIDQETLILILKRDTLGIREFKLHNFLIKWAKHQCQKQSISITIENKQKVIGNAINFIRFPVMTKEEFAILMDDRDSRILDNESIIEIFIYLTFMSNINNINSLTSKVQDGNAKKIKYNDTPRCFLGGKEQTISRFCQVESRWGYSGTSDRVRFSVNKRIFVIGFGLYGSIYGKCEYQAIIQLIHFDSCTICAHNATTFTCDGTNTTFRVLFKEPIEISPDNDYIALATLKGPDSFYGTKGLRKVCHDSGGKVTFQFQYASGNNNGTSVEDGQIPEILFLYSS